MDLQAQVPGGAWSAHRQPGVSGVIEALEVKKQTLAPSPSFQTFQEIVQRFNVGKNFIFSSLKHLQIKLKR